MGLHMPFPLQIIMQACSLGHSPTSNVPSIKGCILHTRSQCREKAVPQPGEWEGIWGTLVGPCQGWFTGPRAMTLQTTTGSSAIIWGRQMWKSAEGFHKTICLPLFSIVLTYNPKEWNRISDSRKSIMLPCGFFYWFDHKLLVSELLGAWMHV